MERMRALNTFVPENTRGRLSVSILDANLVKNYGLVKMDPYCRLRVGHVQFETPTHMSGGRAPTWNRTVLAYLPNGVESIYLQIYDERAFSSDELIAWSHIILPPAIFNGETIDEYYRLSGQQGEGEEGMVHLVISFTSLTVSDVTPNQLAANIAREVQHFSQEAPPPIRVEITEEDMKEFAEMFPAVDREVIRCVLEENNGNKEATVSALLQLN